MTIATPPPFNLVVGNDFTAAGGHAFDQAAHVAERIPGSELHLVYVIESGSTPEQAKKLADQLHAFFESKAKTRTTLLNQRVNVHVRSGKPAREIAQLATDVGADLIVVGTHKGPHLKQLFVGSVVERLLAAAPCPVFVAGPPPVARGDAHEPAIEPACPRCVEARFESRGREWWCGRHKEHHAQAHSYSFQRELPLRTHDASVTPTGVDMK